MVGPQRESVKWVQVGIFFSNDKHEKNNTDLERDLECVADLELGCNATGNMAANVGHDPVNLHNNLAKVARLVCETLFGEEMTRVHAVLLMAEMTHLQLGRLDCLAVMILTVLLVHPKNKLMQLHFLVRACASRAEFFQAMVAFEWDLELDVALLVLRDAGTAVSVHKNAARLSWNAAGSDEGH